MFTDINQNQSSLSLSFNQLLLIVSDGRGIFSEGNEQLQASIMKLKELNIFSVFIIVDNPNSSNSIFDIQMPVFGPNKEIQMVSYIDQFPFPFYIILKNIDDLPMILGEALRQWLELIVNN